MGEARPAQEGRLQGTVAVVTGAARGIARATAVAFAQEGADVVGIDTVFANDGIQAFKPLLEMDDGDWQVQIDNTLTGTANSIRAFAPYLVRRGGGRTIVTSSTQRRHGTKYGAAYSASKLTRHDERYAQAIEEAGQTPPGCPTDEEKARHVLIAKTPPGVPWIERENTLGNGIAGFALLLYRPFRIGDRVQDVAPVVTFVASDAARSSSPGRRSLSPGQSRAFELGIHHDPDR
jgi:hypothetical protein